MRSVSILSRSVAGSRTRGDIMEANTYVDRPETRTVTGSHVRVKRCDRTSSMEFAIAICVGAPGACASVQAMRCGTRTGQGRHPGCISLVRLVNVCRRAVMS